MEPERGPLLNIGEQLLASSEVGQSIAITTALAASFLAAWMSNKSIGVKGLPGCGTGSACDAVTKGPWSRWGSMPVAAFGSVVYLVLAVALEVVSSFPHANIVASNISGVVAIVVFGSTVWFVALQLIVVRRFCGYCMLVHTFGSAAAILTLVSVWSAFCQELSVNLASAAAAVLALIGGQVLLTPKTFAVINAPTRNLERDALIAPTPPTQISANPLLSKIAGSSPFMVRQIPLFQGRIIVDTSVFPLVGPTKAPLVLGYLLDYTCHECHHMHRLLYEAIDEYDGKLAVALIPVPLHHSCNPTVNCPKQERVQACWYARLMFALWMKNPDRFGEWDRFMAVGEEHQPFGFASAKANELADLRSFRLNERDERVDPRIADGIKLYEAAAKPAIPSLILPGGILRGHIPDKATLLNLLKKLVPDDPRPFSKRGRAD